MQSNSIYMLKMNIYNHKKKTPSNKTYKTMKNNPFYKHSIKKN